MFRSPWWRRPGSMAKVRRRHPVARLNTIPARRACHHLEDRTHRTSGRDDLIGKRLSVLGDPMDAPIRFDEDHIERYISIVHPHRYFLIALEVEQHAVGFRKRSAEHQSALTLLVGHRKVHR